MTTQPWKHWELKQAPSMWCVDWDKEPHHVRDEQKSLGDFAGESRLQRWDAAWQDAACLFFTWGTGVEWALRDLRKTLPVDWSGRCHESSGLVRETSRARQSWCDGAPGKCGTCRWPDAASGRLLWDPEKKSIHCVHRWRNLTKMVPWLAQWLTFGYWQSREKTHQSRVLFRASVWNRNTASVWNRCPQPAVWCQASGEVGKTGYSFICLDKVMKTLHTITGGLCLCLKLTNIAN